MWRKKIKLSAIDFKSDTLSGIFDLLDKSFDALEKDNYELRKKIKILQKEKHNLQLKNNAWEGHEKSLFFTNGELRNFENIQNYKKDMENE